MGMPWIVTASPDKFRRVLMWYMACVGDRARLPRSPPVPVFSSLLDPRASGVACKPREEKRREERGRERGGGGTPPRGGASRRFLLKLLTDSPRGEDERKEKPPAREFPSASALPSDREPFQSRAFGQCSPLG